MLPPTGRLAWILGPSQPASCRPPLPVSQSQPASPVSQPASPTSHPASTANPGSQPQAAQPQLCQPANCQPTAGHEPRAGPAKPQDPPDPQVVVQGVLNHLASSCRTCRFRQGLSLPPAPTKVSPKRQFGGLFGGLFLGRPPGVSRGGFWMVLVPFWKELGTFLSGCL